MGFFITFLAHFVISTFVLCLYFHFSFLQRVIWCKYEKHHPYERWWTPDTRQLIFIPFEGQASMEIAFLFFFVFEQPKRELGFWMHFPFFFCCYFFSLPSWGVDWQASTQAEVLHTKSCPEADGLVPPPPKFGVVVYWRIIATALLCRFRARILASLIFFWSLWLKYWFCID